MYFNIFSPWFCRRHENTMRWANIFKQVGKCLKMWGAGLATDWWSVLVTHRTIAWDIWTTWALIKSRVAVCQRQDWNMMRQKEPLTRTSLYVPITQITQQNIPTLIIGFIKNKMSMWFGDISLHPDLLFVTICRWCKMFSSFFTNLLWIHVG